MLPPGHGYYTTVDINDPLSLMQEFQRENVSVSCPLMGPRVRLLSRDFLLFINTKQPALSL